MASITKHGADTIKYIRHNMRMLPAGKSPSNEEIDPVRTKRDNYAIIRRGDTPEEVNKYRKELEKEFFQYNRKNLVHTLEAVITLPEDCKPEQERQFFEQCTKYIASTLGEVGERAIISAEVHKDEGRVHSDIDGTVVTECRPHIHIIYIPVVPDTKHPGYSYKLCADQLTRLTQMKKFHPDLQKWLNDAGVEGTVYFGKSRKIGEKNLDVKVLKQLTKETGMTIDQIRSLNIENERLKKEIDQLKEIERNPEGWNRNRDTERDRGWGNGSGWNRDKEVHRSW